MRNFPDLLAAYLKYCENHESTKRVQLWSILSVVAGAMERKCWLDRGYYTLFPNLYVFIIGKSGLIKKSTSTNIAVDLLREVPGVFFSSEKFTQSSLIGQMGAALKTYTNKAGSEVKQSPVFAYASELAVTLGEVYGSVIELLTTFFDCVPYNSEIPWMYKTKSMGNTNIYGPCLNILGASTKEWLIKCIPEAEHVGGFTSRCIFVVEENLPENLVAWPMLSKDHRGIREMLVMDLQHIASLNGAFKPSPKMYKDFEAWYINHMQTIAHKNENQKLNGYLARKGDMILKLAMIRSATLSDSLTIESDHFEWALEQLDAIEPDMMNTFVARNLAMNSKKLRGVDPIASQSIFDAIVKAGAFPDEEMKQLIGRDPSMRTQLMLLLKHNEVAYVTGENGQNFWKASAIR